LDEVSDEFIDRVMESYRANRPKIMGRGWLSPQSIITGLFIREYIRVKGEAYPYEIYQALKKVRMREGLRHVSTQKFYLLFYKIKSLGLVQPTGRTEKAYNPAGKELILERRYYTLNPDLTDSPCWINPQKYRSADECRA